MLDKSHKKVVVLGTGGTIAGLAASAHDNLGYTAAQVAVTQLLESLPRPPGFGHELVAEQLAQIDSKDMGFAVWQRLAQRCQQLVSDPAVQGIVITHGTDTMEETAYFLHAVLSGGGILAKPVVLTGAMRPASSLTPDGPQNLLDALTLAAHADACGVLVVFAGTVHAAVDVQKVHTYKLDAFGSGDAGPIAYVEEGAVRMVRGGLGGGSAAHLREADAVPCGAATAAFSLPSESAAWPRVEIVMSYAGAGASMVDGLLSHGLASDNPVRGIVVAATGNGSLHQDLETALLRAQANGVSVVRATRCTAGRVLAKAGDAIPGSEGLSAVKARIALMLGLMQTASADNRPKAVPPAG